MWSGNFRKCYFKSSKSYFGKSISSTSHYNCRIIEVKKEEISYLLILFLAYSSTHLYSIHIGHMKSQKDRKWRVTNEELDTIIQHFPSNWSVYIKGSKLGTKVLNPRTPQMFRENIYKLVIGADVCGNHISWDDFLLNKMTINFNVFCHFVKD